MSAFAIKLVAIITMIIDHIGLFFFPQVIIFRIIGRLAFPLFAWLIANGARHSRDINKYLKRLLIFAFIAQIPFLAAHWLVNAEFWSLNVLFTLFLGLVAIKVIKETQDKKLWWLAIALTASTAQLLKTDYGLIGVISIVLFYLFFENRKYLILSQTIIYILPLMVWTAVPPAAFFIQPFIVGGFIQPFCLLSLFLLYLYNKKEGLKAKYLFYVFYPLQYLVIFIIKIFFNN